MKYSLLFVAVIVQLAFYGCDPASTNSSNQDRAIDSVPVNEKPVSASKIEPVEDSAAVFQAEYEKWYAGVTVSGEFCTEDKCAEAYVAFEEEGEWESDCFIGLPERPEYLLGELNGDGLPDAVAVADWMQCDGGNALHAAETWLVFLSQSDGNYITIDAPDALESMDIGGIYEINGGTMMAMGLAYHDDDPRCCPSISWEVEYRVVDGKVVETAISEKVREEME